MDRRAFIGSLAGSLLAAPRVHERLSALGGVEGRTLSVDTR